MGLGYLWGREFPIIKNLWTSSFVLVAGGFSLMLLGLFYTVVDVWKIRFWTLFFVVIGMNAITIYVAQNIIPFREITGFFLNGFAQSRYCTDLARPVLMAAGVLTVKWLFLYHLYRNKTFLRV